jgi:hypothetical protein
MDDDSGRDTRKELTAGQAVSAANTAATSKTYTVSIASTVRASALKFSEKQGIVGMIFIMGGESWKHIKERR